MKFSQFLVNFQSSELQGKLIFSLQLEVGKCLCISKVIGIIQGEKVQIVNNDNGERLETYCIPGPRKSGEITLNGAAARKVAAGDILILITYARMDIEEAKKFNPSLVFPNEENNLLN